MEENAKVLYPNEIDCLLESLQVFDICEIGNARWFRQQDSIYRLSLQASVDVKSGGEELVKEEIVFHQKVTVLVYDLITTDLWILKVLPHILQSDCAERSIIPLYMVLYHEITLASFLETLLFHEDVVESAGDTLLDLVDYCYQKIVALTSIKPEEIEEEDERSIENREKLISQKKKMDFEAGMKSISIISCITQHKKTLPLSVLHRLLVFHDVPLLFTELMCDPPWIWRQSKKDGIKKYVEGKWVVTSNSELIKLSKVEGQLWIALIQLLLDPECQKKYDMSGFRKDQILKLRSKLNEVVIDQIPVLNEMLRYLEHLSLFDAPLPKSDLLIEQLPEIRDNLLEKNKGKWKEIAKMQTKAHFSLSDTEMKDLCTKLSDSFNSENIEAMMSPLTSQCANCKEVASKRCGRCRTEYYCGKSCQVSHWKMHKEDCLRISKNSSEENTSR